MKIVLHLLALTFCLFNTAAFAKEHAVDTAKSALPPIPKFYIGSGGDAAILSTATIEHTTVAQTPYGPVTTTSNSLGMIRFSGFLNIGATFNWNCNRHLGIYTGLNIKNIGYIEQTNGFNNKYRTYNIGAPLGIKVGNMAPKCAYAFLGGGVDFPFAYKEKHFQIRGQKTKLNEWFSDRTATVMPYVFAGLAINRGITFKLQYYPDNYINPDFKDKQGNQPFLGTEVHLILLSIGFAVPMTRQHDLVKKNVNELHTL